MEAYKFPVSNVSADNIPYFAISYKSGRGYVVKCEGIEDGKIKCGILPFNQWKCPAFVEAFEDACFPYTQFEFIDIKTELDKLFYIPTTWNPSNVIPHMDIFQTVRGRDISIPTLWLVCPEFLSIDFEGTWGYANKNETAYEELMKKHKDFFPNTKYYQ